jgi:hypothetical protein
MAVDALRHWSPRRWKAAAVGAVITALALGLPTDVIPNPVFGRPVPVTWWSYPVLAVSAVLGGLLLATYVRDGRPPEPTEQVSRLGTVGGLLTFFAIGCPVCNKVVVVALGTSGALTWFEPVQPWLGVISLGLLAVAVRSRLRGELACPWPQGGTSSASRGTVELTGTTHTSSSPAER